jgi:predicted MFS family arabinose efflux permease
LYERFRPMIAGGESARGPLGVHEFRLLWFSGLAINLAVWIQGLGASWLMMSLAPSALMVALIQTAQSLPGFLLGLPSGVMADLVDRRKLVLAAYGLLLVASAAASVAVLTDSMTPMLLLVVTATAGAGFALQAPAVHTSQAEAVPREKLFAALALSAVSFNVARAVGPALAGAIMSFAGNVAVFAVCALFCAFACVNALRWRHRSGSRDVPPERVLLGVRGALQYARHSPVIRKQLLRTLLFVGAASGLWALLPIVARERLRLDADGYGLLLGCLGTGAIFGSFAAERLRRRWSFNNVGIASTLAYSVGVVFTAMSFRTSVVCIALGLAGAGWAVVGNVNLTAIQTAIPPWVRARAMALYLLVFQGAMAAGGVIWGAVATRSGLEYALLMTTAALAVTAVLMRAMPARIGDAAEATPSEIAAPPALHVMPRAQDGPIAVEVNYLIRPQDRAQFLEVMQALGRSRRRDGAMFWRIYRDLGHPQRYAERFVVRSWSDYLRQRARVTEADQTIERQAWSLHAGTEAPEMQHMLAERMTGED